MAAPAEYSYTSWGGSQVTVPTGMNADDARAIEKQVYIAQVHTSERDKRALVQLKYDLRWHLTQTPGTRWTKQDGDDDFYVLNQSDPFFPAIIGDTKKVKDLIAADPDLVSRTDPSNGASTMLYYACRAGFLDLVSALLTLGAPINAIHSSGSTPLHAACYFGHEIVISRLLAAGPDREIKNIFGNTAQNEARTKVIKAALADVKTNLQPLIDGHCGENLRHVEVGTRTIAWKVSRPALLIDEDISSMTVPEDWHYAWHGTKVKSLLGIMSEGLYPAGENGIFPPQGHIPLGRAVFGIANWAGAVFASPDVLYASHPLYAGRLGADGDEWITLVLTRVRPGTHQTFKSTAAGYVPVGEALEAVAEELRIPTVLPGHFQPQDLEGHPPMMKSQIWRVPNDYTDGEANCVVTDTVLLSKKFMESGEMTREELSDKLIEA